MRVAGIFFLFVLALAFSSCKKKEENPPSIEYYNIDPDMKAKLLFGAGTYWVYKNQAGLTDSVTVTSKQAGVNIVETGHAGPTVHQEYASMVMNSSASNSTYHYFYFTDQVRFNGNAWGPTASGQPIYCHNKPMAYSIVPDAPLGPMTIVDKLDSFSIQGHMFYHVTKVFVDANPMNWQGDIPYDTYFYFVEWGGLIRKEVNDPVNGMQTWDLVDFHIVP